MRNYLSQPGFTEDYNRVKEFIIRINQENVVSYGYLWGRWEWAFSCNFQDKESLNKIGIWEDDGKIVAVATYEDNLGSAYFLVDSEYNHLKGEMLTYAEENLTKNGEFKAIINNNDREFQRAAASLGYRPTKDYEANAVIDIYDENTAYTLPEGYKVVSLQDEYDLYKYNRVLWRGFNHEGEPPVTEEAIQGRKNSLSGPGVNLSLNIAVVAPNGDFVSYCGMWYKEGTDYALVEPVATDPDYRKKGLGKAVVLEAVKRCGQLGAKRAYVGSSQQFYYNIGFHPIPAETWWMKK